MKYLKTFEKVKDEYISTKEMLYEAIINDYDFIEQGSNNIYFIKNGKRKRFLFRKNNKWTLYYNDQIEFISQQQYQIIKDFIILIFGLHDSDLLKYKVRYLEYLSIKRRNIADEFWVIAADKLGRDIVVEYLLKRVDIFIRNSKTYRSILSLPKTILMIINEDPSYYDEFKEYLPPSYLKKVPDSVKRASAANLWL